VDSLLDNADLKREFQKRVEEFGVDLKPEEREWIYNRGRKMDREGLFRLAEVLCIEIKIQIILNPYVGRVD
jgi:hypothetical protein